MLFQRKPQYDRLPSQGVRYALGMSKRHFKKRKRPLKTAKKASGAKVPLLTFQQRKETLQPFLENLDSPQTKANWKQYRKLMAVKVSREHMGCSCVGECQPGTCECLQNGIPCRHIKKDRSIGGGCLCTKGKCANKNPRILGRKKSVLRQTLREEDGFTVKRRRSSRHPKTKLCALAYADDIAISSNTPDGAERTLHRLVSSDSRVGLEISKPKREVIHIGDSDPPGPTTFSCGERVSECSDFKYLGVSTASPSHVVHTRFDQAWSAMSALMPIFTSKALDRIKIRLFRATIESILCYGMESIPLTPTLSRSIDSRYQLCSDQPSAYSTRLGSPTTNSLRTQQLPPLSTTLRLRLVGHILRMQTRSKSPLGELLLNSESGHLRRGQGRTVTLLNDITTDLSSLCIDDMNTVATMPNSI
ncbi:hypothetical protein ACOMHN_059854 [Nucella lapillus]